MTTVPADILAVLNSTSSTLSVDQATRLVALIPPPPGTPTQAQYNAAKARQSSGESQDAYYADQKIADAYEGAQNDPNDLVFMWNGAAPSGRKILAAQWLSALGTAAAAAPSPPPAAAPKPAAAAPRFAPASQMRFVKGPSQLDLRTTTPAAAQAASEKARAAKAAADAAVNAAYNATPHPTMRKQGLLELVATPGTPHQGVALRLGGSIAAGAMLAGPLGAVVGAIVGIGWSIKKYGMPGVVT